MLKTSVVIPTKNNIDTIDRCLSSLMPYYEGGYIGEIIVVDGNSTDGTLDVVKRYPAKLLFDEGRGFNVACEIGWRNSKGELIIFLDADAYLEEGFFPKVYEFFSDERIGVMGCHPKAVVSNRLTKTIGEQWEWSAPTVGISPFWVRRLYYRIATGENEVPPGGPCHVIKRTCLEAVNGFSMSDARGGEDIYLSRRIVDKGWKSTWWVDAPLYHYPRTSLRAWAKEHYRFGKEATYRETREQLANRARWYNKLISIIARLGSPLVGLMLAIRFRNPLHLFVYPLPRYAWVIGYLAGWFSARKSKGR